MTSPMGVCQGHFGLSENPPMATAASFANSDPVSPPYQPAQSGLRLTDLLVRLWRAKWLMLLIFLPIAALGAYAATQMPTTYTASSRLFVSLGDEYVFRPRVGSDAAGTAPQLEELIQAELELLRSPVVAERALRRFPLERIYPDLAEAMNDALAEAPAAEQDKVPDEYFQAGVDQMQRSFSASAAPKTPVIATTFDSADRETSTEVLNALIGAYFAYRTEVFQDRNSASFADQRERFQARLADSNTRIQAFLAEHEIGDFGAEQATAQSLFQSISQTLLDAETNLGATRQELADVRRQLSALEPEMNLYVDDASDQTLLDLRLERESLLSRYREDSRTVRAIDARIAQAEAFLAEKEGPVGTVRRGPNPVFQDLQTSAGGIAGRAAFQQEQVAELRRQLASVGDRQRRLAALEPQWQALQREQQLLAENVRSFSERELEAKSREEIAQQAANNIRVLEPARTPMDGSSLALPVAAIGVLFAGFSALMAGLLYALTRPGLSTAASVGRAAGLPIVAAIPKRRA